MAIADLKLGSVILPRSESPKAISRLTEFEWFHKIDTDNDTVTPEIDDLLLEAQKTYQSIDDVIKGLGVPQMVGILEIMFTGKKIKKKDYEIDEIEDMVNELKKRAPSIIDEPIKLLEEQTTTKRSLEEYTSLKETLEVAKKLNIDLSGFGLMKYFYTNLFVVDSKDYEEISKTLEVQQQTQTNDIETTAPGKLRVIKRNGKVVAFEEDKIKVAITKAFLATESGNAAASERIHKKVNAISSGVIEVFERRMPSGGTLHIEEIQDQVELQLMRSEELEVARSYILYRAGRTQERKKVAPEIDIPNKPKINITKTDGTLVPLDVDKVAALINDACDGLEEVSMNVVLEEALKNLKLFI